MFGYVRPLKDELKVREFDQFKACYCALCHTLESRYGAFSRNILNYDFVFLAMLLWDKDETPAYRCARCVASPIRRKKTCAPSKVLDACAGYSVILAYWKLRDSIWDEGFFGSLRDRLLLVFLSGANRKAAARYPSFAETVRCNLEALRTLESSGNASLDACADKFARITEALAQEAAGDSRYRPLQQLLYHTGRVIYLIDACDDLEEDQKKGRFNPLSRRFGLKEGKLSDEDRELLRTTVLHSCGLIGSAYELLPGNAWSEILKNIVYLGLPEACHKVLEGTWKKERAPENRRNGQYYE